MAATTAETIISAVVPPSLAAPRAKHDPPPPLNLAELRRDGTTFFGMAAIDDHGRFSERRLIRTLAWRARERIDVALHADVIVMRAHPGAADAISSKWLIKLPLPIRRWRSLAAGDRLLLVSMPAAGILLAYDSAALDSILTSHHAQAPGP